MFDIKKVIEDAQKEVSEEKISEAKRRIKQKLKERDTAKKILANINRELEDLYAELSQDN
jgi:hypothetical protein